MNITKFAAFVIFCCLICSLFSGCSRVFSNLVNSNINKPADKEQISKAWGKAKVLGKIISDEIRESSGIAASRCNKGAYWTHNDSGDDAFIFAINEKGEKLGTFRIRNAKNYDWEDIAASKEDGRCYLYIGEIGNNKRARSEMAIYKVAEPQISAEDSKASKKKPAFIDGAETIKFTYPDSAHDAETLMVNPETGDIYILTKSMIGASAVFRIPAGEGILKTAKAKKVADLSVPALPNGFLTGGDISPDGKRLVVCDYFNAYEFLLPADAKNFDEIWKAKPAIIELGKREQGEAICYSADGRSLIATSEKKNSPIIEVERK